MYTDEQFAALYPVEGQPAYAPWRLAVVTVLQYSENLTDRQAANAVRERIDWKSHGLRNELTDSERLLPNGLLEGKEPLFFQQGDLHDKYR
ncbi:MAG TPA: transposase [Ktedonobacteraceae bacterium]|nr:transposase [Ktedonobacteraceae bacterium]